jgi:hypothetical protein
LTNPSKRNEKARFLIHIGAGFVVGSYCMRLDKLEPPVFGSNTPEQWIMECCEKIINENCSYKTFIIELEIKDITYAPKLNNANTLIRMKAKRDEKWLKQNKNSKMNPSKRDDED